MRFFFNPLRLTGAVFVLLILAEFNGLHLFVYLENRFSDLLVQIQARSLAPDQDIVIVDIDEASLAKMQDIAGSWPWPRAVHAELIEGLARQQPKAIVFDILFSEPDSYRPDSDKLFNQAAGAIKNAYFPMVRLDPHQDVQGAPLAQVGALLGIKPGIDAQPNARIAILPPLALRPENWRTGTINFDEDGDGVGRRYHLRIPAYGWEIPSLPARVAADLGYTVPADNDITLGWRGAAGSYRHISYSDLYQDFSRRKPQRDPTELKNKIIIIGATASGLHDIRATPVASLYPAVEILATALDNLKNRGYMQTVPRYLPSTLELVLLFALFGAFQYNFNALKVGLALLFASLLLLLTSYLALNRHYLLPVLAPLTFAWGFYFSTALIGYLQEKKSREQTVQLFARFLDPRVVHNLVTQNKASQSLSGQACEITVLFSDIRGFTTLSETKPPEEIVALLNRYFSLQVEAIFRQGGTLDKFIGDAIMAFWGAPQEDNNHAEHAITAALQMVEHLAQFKQEVGAAGETFDIGIGIHSGEAVVGFIGSEHRLDYTAIGDTVNLASRIEGLTKNVARVLVSRETVQHCQDAFDFIPHGSYKVKGRVQAVELFEPKRKPA